MAVKLNQIMDCTTEWSAQMQPYAELSGSGPRNFETNENPRYLHVLLARRAEDAEALVARGDDEEG